MHRFSGREIVTRAICPPIPTKRFDYEATFDGYDEGEPIGYGPTPEAAKAELLELVEDEEDEPEVHPVFPSILESFGF